MYRFGNDTTEHIRRALSEELGRLDRLAADLRTFGLQPRPTQHLLSEAQADAPILEDWRVVLRPVLGLEGFASGHPVLPGRRRQIVTSELWLISEELGWARTYSRWYRLGRRRCDRPEDY